MRLALSITCIVAVTCVSVSQAYADDLSFEAWEAGIGEDLEFERSGIENFGLQEASAEELSNTVIENALRSAPSNKNLPAYKQRQTEEGRDKDDNTQKLLKEREGLSDFVFEPPPQSIEFDQGVFTHDTGRDLSLQTTTVERQ